MMTDFETLEKEISEVLGFCEILSFGIYDTEDNEIQVTVGIPNAEFSMQVFFTENGDLIGARENLPSSSESHLFFRGILTKCSNNLRIKRFCNRIIEKRFVTSENFDCF